MPKTTSIEDHFELIEGAISALEGGELPLEQALERYEQGLKAVRIAKQQLDKYAAKLEELRVQDDSDTNGSTP